MVKHTFCFLFEYNPDSDCKQLNHNVSSASRTSQWGAPLQRREHPGEGGTNLLFGFFVENFIKMKNKMDWGGLRVTDASRSATDCLFFIQKSDNRIPLYSLSDNEINLIWVKLRRLWTVKYSSKFVNFGPVISNFTWLFFHIRDFVFYREVCIYFLNNGHFELRRECKIPLEKNWRSLLASNHLPVNLVVRVFPAGQASLFFFLQSL